MMGSSRYDLDEFLTEERINAVEEFEKSLVAKGLVPDRERLLMRRLKTPLRYLGALVIAGLVALLALYANFMILNEVIHINA